MINVDKTLVITHYDSSVDGTVTGSNFKSFMLMTLGAEGKDTKASLKLTRAGGLESSRLTGSSSSFAEVDILKTALNNAVKDRLTSVFAKLQNRAAAVDKKTVQNKIDDVKNAFSTMIRAAVDEDMSGLNCGKVKAIVRNVRWFDSNVTIDRLLGMATSDLTHLATSKSARAKADNYLDPDEAEVLKRCSDIENAVDRSTDQVIESAITGINNQLAADGVCFLSEQEQLLKNEVKELNEFVELAKSDTNTGRYDKGTRKDVLTKLKAVSDKIGFAFHSKIEQVNSDYDAKLKKLEEELKTAPDSRKEKIRAEINGLDKDTRTKIDSNQFDQINDAVNMTESKIKSLEDKLATARDERNACISKIAGNDGVSCLSIDDNGKIEVNSSNVRQLKNEFKSLISLLKGSVKLRENIKSADNGEVKKRIKKFGISPKMAKSLLIKVEDELNTQRWAEIYAKLCTATFEQLPLDKLLSACSKTFVNAGFDLTALANEYGDLKYDARSRKLVGAEGVEDKKVKNTLINLLGRKLSVKTVELDEGRGIGLDSLAFFEDELDAEKK